MSTLLEILIHDILPVFVVIGLGYGFARRNQVELRTATRLTFYVLSPCLVFVSLVESNMGGGETAQIFLLVLLMVLLMGALAWIAGRALRLTAQQLVAFLLAAMFVNAGNYGLGVTRLAFGDESEARAVIYFVSSSILIYTLGTLLASGFKGGWRGAIKHLLMLPQVYALLAVFLIRATGWTVPEPIMDGLRLPAQATIPMMLLLLGMQLAKATLGEYWKAATVGTVLRLAIAPVVAVVLATLLNLSGPARQAGILEASMPTAVISTLIANEYEAEPQLVTGTVLLSTLLSPLSLSIIIALLK
ncbi:MAG TPA: AEC family transporter [Anaerolineae bacterium]|nr:AEC family transporter [Anaerolineae bacterium]